MSKKSLDIASEILPEENLGLFQANILAMHLETVLPFPSTMYINGDFRSRTKKHWNHNIHKGEMKPILPWFVQIDKILSMTICINWHFGLYKLFFS